MQTDDTLSVELPTECEARLLQFARMNRLSVEDAVIFLVSRGVKHLSSEPSQPVEENAASEETRPNESEPV